MTLVARKHLTGAGWEAFGREGVRSAPYLPFDLPIYDGTEKKIAAHYFTQFVRRGAGSAPNTYANAYWMPPGAVEGSRDHRVYGGFVRDWHLFEASPPTTGDYLLYDHKREVRNAIAAGIDMWTMNILTLGNSSLQHWPRIVKMAQAIEEVNAEDGTDFRMLLMPDGVSGATSSVRTDPPVYSIVDVDASADILADYIYDLAQAYPDALYYDEDGDLVVGPFGGEKVPSGSLTKSSDGTAFTVNDRPYFWRRFKDRLLDPPDDISHVPMGVKLWICTVDSWTTAAARFETYDPTLVDGWGRWGERDVTASGSTSINNRDAARYCHDTYGKPWMAPVSPMDSRPPNDGTSAGGTYRTWESLGSRQWDASWLSAIGEGYDESDMVQIPTWNDFTENAHICPTRNLGTLDEDGNPVSVFGDLNHYYAAKYKTGNFPTVRRDGLYLFHRQHRKNAAFAHAALTTSERTAAGKQSRVSVKTGSTDIADIVEVLAFITDACDVELYYDEGSGPVLLETFEVAVAGVHSLTANLPTGEGTLSAKAVRGGVTVEGTEVVSEQPLWGDPIDFDDFHYRGWSSLRQHLAAA